MKIALAQINPTVGDLEGNCRKIHEFHQRARVAGAGLVVFPELSLVGYPPLDLLGRRSFVERCQAVLHQLAAEIRGAPALVGCVLPSRVAEGRALHNAAVLLDAGKVQAVVAKTRLPTYDVFDEDRYFEPAAERRPLMVGGLRVGVTICEDIWQAPVQGGSRYQTDPVEDLKREGIDLLVNLSASPFHAGKGKEREELLRSIARRLRSPVVLTNQVGGNDSLLFDGRSLAVGSSGKLVARAEAFREDLVLLDLETEAGEIRPSPPEGAAELFQAIIMGLRDYLDKCGFTQVALGLSGGVDSAVVAVLAAEAVGPAKVFALAMPSAYSSPQSRMDAEQLSKNLGIQYLLVPIVDVVGAFKQILRPGLGDITTTLTEENLQARVRGAVVMAYANHESALALATGNKSELATGYCTLYGDMAGGISPIGDLFKTQVYELAAYINRNEELIPRRILERPPSAELRPNQTDQDTLPPYQTLDPILEQYLGEARDVKSIAESGFPIEVVEKVACMVELSEFKRRQAAPVLRVSRRAFGAGRQIPIARSLRQKKLPDHPPDNPGRSARRRQKGKR